MLHRGLLRLRDFANFATDPRYRAFHRQRRIGSVAERSAAADIIARGLPGYPAGGGGELARDGVTFLPPLLTPDQISEVVTYFADKLATDIYGKGGPFLAPDDAPAGTHTANYSLGDILDCPHLLAAANDPAVLAAVAGYLGAAPTLAAMRAWWSLPHGEAPARTELFHRDVDDLRFVKLFVYLTDVDEGSGPHIFVKGSHTVDRLTELRRFSDEEVAEAFGGHEVVTITGPAGTTFLEATYGVHRGLPPTERPRLVFQPLYTLRASIYAPKRPLRARRTDEMPLDPWVNRLMLLPTPASRSG